MSGLGSSEKETHFYIICMAVFFSVQDERLEVVLQDVLAGKHANISRWMLAACLFSHL